MISTLRGAVQDIPDFLKEVIKVDKDTLVLDNKEGEERVPVGSVIAFEKLESGKMNVWIKGDWKTTTTEKDGVFYEIPHPVLGFFAGEELPDELVEGLGDNLTKSDGAYHLKTNWGVSSAEVSEGYFLVYGKKENGQLDASILSVGTPSFDQYYVCDENNQIKESLNEYHKRTHGKGVR